MEDAIIKKLIEQAEIIKSETNEGANTAWRIGTMFENIIKNLPNITGNSSVGSISVNGENFVPDVSGTITLPNYPPKCAFDELFEKVTEGELTYIRAKYGLASVGFISAFGTNPSGGSGGGGGVASIMVNGSQYNPNAEGVITLPDYPSVQTLTWANITDKPSWIGDSKPSYTASEVGALPATHAASGVTTEKIANWDSAFAWGDHSKAGYLTNQSLAGYATEKWVENKKYLTGITSAMVTTALGFTPFDGASFTKANIKSTLGISDWALAASKPSYNLDDVADGTTRKLSNYLLASTFNDLFEKVTEGGVTYIKAKYGLASVGFISAFGTNSGGSTGGAGSIIVNGQQYNPNADGVITLPNYPTSLTWGAISGKPTTIAGYGITDAITTGNIGSQTVAKALSLGNHPNGSVMEFYSNEVNFGSGKAIYIGYRKVGNNDAPTDYYFGENAGGARLHASLKGNADTADYATVSGAAGAVSWTNVSGRPTALSSFTDDVVSGHYLPLTGGTIKSTVTDVPLFIQGNSSVPYIGFRNNSNIAIGYIGITATELIYYRDKGYVVYHSGNSNKSDYNWTADVLIGNYISVKRKADGANAFYIENESGTSGYKFRATGGSGYFTFCTNYGDTETEKMRIASNGSVGIGTSSPSQILHLYSAASDDSIRLQNASGNVHFGQDANGGYIYESSNLGFAVFTNSARRFTITNEGNVGIGTASPSYKLDVNGNIGISGHVNITKGIIDLTNDYQIQWGSQMIYGNNSSKIINYISSTHYFSGNVGIGTSSPSQKLHVSGNILASGEVTAFSDMRLKSVIANRDIEVSAIANAPLFAFKWNDREDRETHVGSSAQYWLGVTPELVLGSEETQYSLNYATLGVACAISIAKKVMSHEQRIEQLERENKELRMMLNVN